jgi:hypothetical protein
MRRRNVLWVGIATTMAACITVNIYFPARSAGAAEEIVDETWAARPPRSRRRQRAGGDAVVVARRRAAGAGGGAAGGHQRRLPRSARSRTRCAIGAN